MCVFNDFNFITEAQINITIAMPVLLARCVKYPRLEGLLCESPSKEVKRGLCQTAYRTQRIERKIITY